MTASATKTRSAKAKRPQSSRRACVLVVGMHRSGTSALTRVLNLLGCDLPKTLMPAQPDNEAGYWESAPICQLNERILASAGTRWDDWSGFSTGWLHSPKAEEFREEAITLLGEEYGSSRLFVLKDPRLCRLLPFWLGVLEQFGARPVLFSPVRSPLEVAASLQRRDGFEPALGHLLWLRHVLDAESASRDIPRFFTSYDRLMQGWARVATDAQAKLGVAWPLMSDQAVASVDAFLSNQHRHHHEPPEAVVDNPTLSAWLRESFGIFNAWAAAGENAKDYVHLDRIRAELNAATPAFSRLISAGQEAFQKKVHLENVLAEARARLTAAEEAKETERQRSGRLEKELDTARQWVSEQEQHNAQLRIDLETQASAAEAAERALTDIRTRLEAAEAAAEAEQQNTRRLDSDLDAARRQLNEKDLHIAQLRSDLAVQADAVKTAERARAEADASLAAAQSAAAAEHERSRQLESELGGVRQRLEEHEQQVEVLRSDLAAQTQAAKASEQARHDLQGELDAARQRTGDQDEQLTLLRRDLESYARAADAAEQDMAASRSKLSQAEAAAAAERQASQRLAAELESARQRLAGNEQEIAHLRAGFEARGRALKGAGKDLAATRAKLRQAETAASAEQQRTKGLEGELGGARQRLADQQREIAQLRSGLEDRARAAEEAERTCTELRDRLAQTESALAQRRHEAEQTAAELAAAREELRHMAAVQDDSEKTVGGLKDHVLLLMADLKERRSQLTQRGEDVARLKRSLEDAQARAERQRADDSARLQQAEAEAESARAEIARLQSRVQDDSDELARLRHLLEEKTVLLEHKTHDGLLEAERLRQMARRDVGRTVAALLNGRTARIPWKTVRLKRQATILSRSGLFDPEWYLREYSDVASAGLDPLWHYVEYGAKEGRAPNRGLAVAEAPDAGGGADSAAAEPEPAGDADESDRRQS